jgi:hypothetical protein
MTVDGMGIRHPFPPPWWHVNWQAGPCAKIYDWVPTPLHFFARFDVEKSPVLMAQAAAVAVEVARPQSWHTSAIK